MHFSANLFLYNKQVDAVSSLRRSFRKTISDLFRFICIVMCRGNPLFAEENFLNRICTNSTRIRISRKGRKICDPESSDVSRVDKCSDISIPSFHVDTLLEGQDDFVSFVAPHQNEVPFFKENCVLIPKRNKKVKIVKKSKYNFAFLDEADETEENIALLTSPSSYLLKSLFSVQQMNDMITAIMSVLFKSFFSFFASHFNSSETTSRSLNFIDSFTCDSSKSDYDTKKNANLPLISSVNSSASFENVDFDSKSQHSELADSSVPPICLFTMNSPMEILNANERVAKEASFIEQKVLEKSIDNGVSISLKYV